MSQTSEPVFLQGPMTRMWPAEQFDTGIDCQRAFATAERSQTGKGRGKQESAQVFAAAEQA